VGLFVMIGYNRRIYEEDAGNPEGAAGENWLQI
jgi:hypothetical protein